MTDNHAGCTFVVGADPTRAGMLGDKLYISVLWIDAPLRGQGLGSALVRQAEQQARDRGCVAARLSTWDFQALGFYAHLGYSLFGKLENYPAGHTVYYLRKDLVPVQA